MAIAMVMVVLVINTVVNMMNYSKSLAKEEVGVCWGKIHDGRDRA